MKNDDSHITTEAKIFLLIIAAWFATAFYIFRNAFE